MKKDYLCGMLSVKDILCGWISCVRGAWIMDGISDFDDAQISALLPLLPQWRRDRALAFKHEEGRRECVLSFALLMFKLEREYGITHELELCYEEHGKPLLRDYPSIHFNLSHCHSAVACVTGSSPVGIDVERRGRYREMLARHVLNSEELATVLGSDDPDGRFLEYWTRKEALLKQRGGGVSGDMRDVLSDHAGVSLFTFAEKDFVCSIAEEVSRRATSLPEGVFSSV